MMDSGDGDTMAAEATEQRQRQHHPHDGGVPRLSRHPEIRHDLETQARNLPRSGAGSIYSCPECGGVLWQVDEGSGVPDGFACHTGHTYGPELLLRLKSLALEAGLYVVLRTLTEKATLTRQLAAAGLPEGGAERARVEALAELDERNAELIRRALLEADPCPTDQALLVEEALERERERQRERRG
jgi:hypothetical protein